MTEDYARADGATARLQYLEDAQGRHCVLLIWPVAEKAAQVWRFAKVEDARTKWAEVRRELVATGWQRGILAQEQV